MKHVRAFLALVLLIVPNTQGQNGATASPPNEIARTFRLNPALPFVYVKFDHIGEGKKAFESEPATRIWLRLVNNCHLPIVLRGGTPSDSSVEGEVFFEEIAVVPNPPLFTITSEVPLDPEVPPLDTTLEEPSTNGWNKSAETPPPKAKPQRPSSAHDDEGRMPAGYFPIDVVSLETIMPGSEALFSVPVNFVSKKWHFEIEFHFAAESLGNSSIPEEGFFSPNPSVRGEVRMVVAYGLNDLPEKYQGQVETINQGLQKKP